MDSNKNVSSVKLVEECTVNQAQQILEIWGTDQTYGLHSDLRDSSAAPYFM